MNLPAHPCCFNTGFIRRIILSVVAIVLLAACGNKAKEAVLPSGSLVVALGDSLTAVFQHLSAADFYRRVAGEQKVPLIEDAIAEVLSNPQLKGDPLHPNVAGHAQLSQKIFDALKAIGYVS